jgi:hypothetical protein
MDRAKISPLYVFYFSCYFPLKQICILFSIFPNASVRVIVLHAAYFESYSRDRYIIIIIIIIIIIGK